MKRKYYRVQEIEGNTVSSKNSMLKDYKSTVIVKADTVAELIKKLKNIR